MADCGREIQCAPRMPGLWRIGLKSQAGGAPWPLRAAYASMTIFGAERTPSRLPASCSRTLPAIAR
jgi:hypothetical protein